jgi:hypothetical protein
MPYSSWSATPKSSFNVRRTYKNHRHGNMVLIEADLRVRQMREQLKHAKTAGLFHPRMFAVLLKPVNTAFLNKKLNDA